MTNDELLKQIQNTLANPQAWVDAGLGHNAVKNAEGWCEERARQLAAWIEPMLPAEIEGWENEETWAVWLDLANDRETLGRFLAMARTSIGAERLGAVVRDYYDACEAERSHRCLWTSLARIALARVDWMSIGEELKAKAQEGSQ